MPLANTCLVFSGCWHSFFDVMNSSVQLPRQPTLHEYILWWIGQHDTYDHRIMKIRLPVRSAIYKHDTGGLVVRWVTTSESLLLYVFALFCPRSEMRTRTHASLFALLLCFCDPAGRASRCIHARQSRQKLNRSAAYINMKTYKTGDLASM